MRKIMAYDVEADKIEKIAEENDASTMEIIMAIFDAIEDNDIAIEDYL